jgi:hypothetical protein
MARPGPNVLARPDREYIGWLCTLRPGGSPHVTPVWFVYRDATWWICVGERSVKARNAGVDGRVSPALEDGVSPVVAEGAVKVHAGAYPEAVVAAFSAKYGGWDITRPLEIGGGSVLFEVPVARWLLLS